MVMLAASYCKVPAASMVTLVAAGSGADMAFGTTSEPATMCVEPAYDVTPPNLKDPAPSLTRLPEPLIWPVKVLSAPVLIVKVLAAEPVVISANPVTPPRAIKLKELPLVQYNGVLTVMSPLPMPSPTVPPV